MKQALRRGWEPMVLLLALAAAGCGGEPSAVPGPHLAQAPSQQKPGSTPARSQDDHPQTLRAVVLHVTGMKKSVDGST